MLKNGLIAGITCLVSVAAFVLIVRDSKEADPPPEQQVIDATVARIAAESFSREDFQKNGVNLLKLNDVGYSTSGLVQYRGKIARGALTAWERSA